MLSEFPARNNDEPLQPVHAAHSEHPSRRAHHPDAFRIPEHVRGGVQWDLFAPGTVTFVLFAPYKLYVSLVGDFNEWDARAHRMVTDGQGLWWITLPHPGATRYGYYVAIDDTSHAWVGDPYAAEVRWEDGTPWAYLPEARSAFPWTDGEWKTPALRDLVIYELCVRDFAGEWAGTHQVYGNFARLLDHLDYLVDTGVNAVELMPIQAFPGNSSWGYNPVLYFAPAQVYGSPEQFKTFVDACHARGIAVILDVAFNHAWGEHPYYQIYPPMYGSHGEWLTDWNPFSTIRRTRSICGAGWIGIILRRRRRATFRMWCAIGCKSTMWTASVLIGCVGWTMIVETPCALAFIRCMGSARLLGRRAR